MAAISERAAEPVPWWSLGACALMLAVLALVLGRLQSTALPGISLQSEIATARQHPLDAIEANLAFQQWQLWWARGCGIAWGRWGFGWPRWALLVDLAFIAAYAYLLAWCVGAALRWQARARPARAAMPRWLNLLAWSLPVAVVCDLAENLATWLVITLVHWKWLAGAQAVGIVMTLLSAAKCAGLLATFGLLAITLCQASMARLPR